MTEKRMVDCLRYTGRAKCHFTGEFCDDKYAQTCTDYKSEDGLYECPYCNLKGLKLLDYGTDNVWECLRCGAELLFCESVSEMQQRCREIRERKFERNE